MKGILGRKIGMTQVFTTDGVLIPVTVVEATENVVLQKKTVATDGYDAVKVGFEDKREKLANKAEKGIANKANTAPKRFIKEFRYDEMMSYEVGDKITVDSFVAGEVVDVTGTSKGKGYQGVIKRHGQHIGPKGHGSGAHRIVGSMGPIAPNRIAPGKKLPGQMGHVTRTIQNLEVVAVDPENNLLLIKGSVPGPKKGLVVVKTAIKKAGQVNPVHELVDYTPEEVEETVVEEAVNRHAPLVGLSALMTTTVPSMEETIKQLRESAPWVKVMVGGAVLTQEYADTIDADAYCKDAMASVHYAETIF